MSDRSVGFIGAGRVARIMLGGWERAGMTELEVMVADPSAEALARLQEGLSEIAVTPATRDRAARQGIVFLAVHPPAMADAVDGLGGELDDGSVVVSLAPGIMLAEVSRLLGGFPHVARSIPNAPSIVGRGYNPVALSDTLPESGRRDLLDLLSALGECPIVDESDLEAYAILTAMGPTYLWFQLHELQRLGESFGIDAPVLQEGLRHMALGTVHTLHEAGLSPEQVMDLIPVKPLGDEEDGIRAIYRARLEALHDKLTGRQS